ncbi:MMPL family transporter [Streptomyces sp. NPDC058374]|uniref:MMPL family transporter n=1 Tax=Streptomyces sp. NPDC058374 TaxID=3346466 RepID=UPI003660D537
MAHTETTPPPAAAIPPPGRLGRIAARSMRHRKAALLLWLVLVAALTAGAQTAGDGYRNDHSLPGTDSQAAADLLAGHGVEPEDRTARIVLKNPDGLDADRGRVTALLDEVEGLPSVTSVHGPWSGGAVSRDGTIGYATVALADQDGHIPAEDLARLLDTVRAADGDGLRTAVGGEATRGAEEAGGGAAEGAGMLAALAILVLFFGSLVAAAVPLVTAVFAVGGALGLIGLAAHLFTVADFTPPVMMLVGLGVGVDYALLIFHRYRTELLAGADRETAAVRAMEVAGRTVLFAGCTVIIALLGLVVLGLGALQGVALSVALTVLVTMAASVTLLPALLALTGARIERHVLAREAKRRAKHGPAADEGTGGGRWAALAAAVGRRPLPVLLAGVAVLAALSAPVLGMRLGFADAGTDPVGSSSRTAYDLTAEGFGPGFSGPLVVVAEGGGAASGQALAATLGEVEGVAAVEGPFPSGDGALTTVLAFPEAGPQDEATAALVRDLRADVLAPLAEESGERYLVGGPTAAALDFADSVGARLPLFVAVVVGLSTLLLLAVFRSLLVPLKAAVLNLLSISAALGVITLVFQNGWFGASSGPVEAFIPVMVFAIVFGLSMDYEVFLVSRMREAWLRTGDARLAVGEGLAATGKVITAAAAIMVVVFAAFVLSPSRMLQQFGLALAVAVLLDAVVIRCLIVPAVMRLLGARAWWLPRPLDRVLGPSGARAG